MDVAQPIHSKKNKMLKFYVEQNNSYLKDDTIWFRRGERKGKNQVL